MDTSLVHSIIQVVVCMIAITFSVYQGYRQIPVAVKKIRKKNRFDTPRVNYIKICLSTSLK